MIRALLGVTPKVLSSPNALNVSFDECSHSKTKLFIFCPQEQVLFFMKDIFDLDKVRYSSLDTLAEDILHLLHRRSELLLAYLGTDMIRHLNGCNATPLHLVPSALLEAQVQ